MESPGPRRRRLAWWTAVVLGVLAVVAVALAATWVNPFVTKSAVGTEHDLSAALEAELTDWFKQRYEYREPVVVTCPTVLPSEGADAFRCTLTEGFSDHVDPAWGSSYFDVTVTGEGPGHYSWTFGHCSLAQGKCV